MVICRICEKEVTDLNYIHIGESDLVPDKYYSRYKSKKSYNLCKKCYEKYDSMINEMAEQYKV